MRDNLSIHLNCMNDSFPCSTTNWSPSNIRNSNGSTMCAAETNNSALVFGLDSASINCKQVVSRSVKTNLLNVSMNASIAREFHTNATSQILCITGFSEMTSAAILTDISTTDALTPLTPYDVLAGVEADVLKKVSISRYSLIIAVIFPQIFHDSQLSNIFESVKLIIINSYYSV